MNSSLQNLLKLTPQNFMLFSILSSLIFFLVWFSINVSHYLKVINTSLFLFQKIHQDLYWIIINKCHKILNTTLRWNLRGTPYISMDIIHLIIHSIDICTEVDFVLLFKDTILTKVEHSYYKANSVCSGLLYPSYSYKPTTYVIIG